MLKKTLEIPLEIKPVNPKGNQPWIFIGKTNADAEIPILWPPVAKNWVTGKNPDAGKDWRQEEKGTTEDEVLGWYHPLDGLEFEQSLGVGDEQGSLACYSPWDRKESDMAEQSNYLICCLPQTVKKNFGGDGSFVSKKTVVPEQHIGQDILVVVLQERPMVRLWHLIGSPTTILFQDHWNPVYAWFFKRDPSW